MILWKASPARVAVKSARNALRRAAIGSGVLALAIVWTLPLPAEILLKTDETIVFLGDSITAQGWTSAHGYVRLVVAGLEANGVKIVAVPAGVGGQCSNDMLARLQRDVLARKPAWVAVSCGMNDVIHGAKGVPLEDYKKNVAAIVDQCQQARIQVLLLTTTLAGNWDSEASRKLGTYSDALRSLATARNCRIVDLYPVFAATARTADSLHALTGDGVHMTPEGNMLIARTLLKAVGCSEPQLAKAHDTWLDLPHAGDLSARVDIVLNKRFFRTTCDLTLRQRNTLLDVAQAAHRPTLMHWSKELLASLLKKKLKPNGPYDSPDAIFDQHKDQQVQGELQQEFQQAIRALVAGK